MNPAYAHNDSDLFAQPAYSPKLAPVVYDKLTDDATLEEMASIEENQDLEEFYLRKAHLHDCHHFQDEFSKRKIEVLKPKQKGKKK